ncbi:HAD family hydrolase [Campylobacter sp. 19-13652]|uniref:HAD family hydrolase n=1 Tax=Campylobacter sp. 19-13652 TaxID=2840180 RepID=UPI001C75876F|nr:HAD family hydrolase [Campylobacter sp. 19-13652]BCX80084.1 hydrolase [Campylobacter sp. 19-13652]
MKKIAILFDLDGTLIDSTDAILNGFDAAFLAHGKPTPDKSYAKSLIGYTLEDIFTSLGAPKDEVASYIKAYREYYLPVFLSQTKLLPRAKEAIELAHSFANLGIVTTKNSNKLPELLDVLGVREYFNVLVGRNDVTRPKPDAEPILTALERLKFNGGLKDVFMIGDTPLDSLAAKAAGVNAISVLCGYASFSTLLEYNDKIFDTTFDAVEFVKTIAG